MSAYGVIGVANPGDAQQPSPAVWADCNTGQLLDDGQGFYEYRTFVGDVTLPGLPSATENSGAFSVSPAFDHAVRFTTGAAAQNSLVAFTRPVGPIAPGNGVKFWMEACVSIPVVTDVKGIFVGLVNKLGQAVDLVAAASATANNNLLTNVALTSAVGFWAVGSALGNFNAVYVNKVAGTGGLTPATVPTVLANVLTANAINPNPANQNFVPALPPGVMTPNVPVKLGLRYDGQQYIYFYVNGSQVAKLAVGSVTFDTTSTYGLVIALSAGTAAAAVTLDVLFARVAVKLT